MTVREIIRMVIVLTIVTGVWGGALSLVKLATQDQIEYQRIKNIKAPALKKALSVQYDNDPVKDRKKIVVGKNNKGKSMEKTIFYAKKNQKIVAVALEEYGTGYDGDVGVMMSITIPENKLGGIAVTTHTETPGVGTKAIDSEKFIGQFSGKPLSTNFSPSAGAIDALTGATYTSHGIQKAVQKGTELFKKFKDKILSQ